MITVGNKGNGSIGDCLWLTVPFKKLIGKIQLHNDSQCKKVSVIYKNIKNIFEVEFTDSPAERIDKIVHGEYPFPQKLLDFYGIKDENCIPKIEIDQEELNWGKNLLKEYKNPIAILADNAGTGRTDNPSARYREVPKECLSYIVKELINKGYTPIQFVLSSGSNHIEGTVKLLDLTIRQMAICYKVIGKHIGGDTGGGCHLALSVGANCAVLIPEHNRQMGYNYNELLFHDHLWKDEPIRVKYINFKNYKEVLDLY